MVAHGGGSVRPHALEALRYPLPLLHERAAFVADQLTGCASSPSSGARFVGPPEVGCWRQAQTSDQASVGTGGTLSPPAPHAAVIADRPTDWSPERRGRWRLCGRAWVQPKYDEFRQFDDVGGGEGVDDGTPAFSMRTRGAGLHSSGSTCSILILLAAEGVSLKDLTAVLKDARRMRWGLEEEVYGSLPPGTLV
eukprot:jgi/Mesen1/3891/ME000208S02904